MSGIIQALLASFSSEVEFALYSWGNSGSGRLGQNNIIARSSPVQVGALTNWAKVSAWNSGGFAIKTDGTMWGWGLNNFGQIGQGSTAPTSISSPAQIGALTSWAQVVGGNYHCIAIKTDGTLWSWGAYFNGVLGDNTSVSKSSPVQVGALTDWAQASAGARHCAAITTGGELYAWGLNGGSVYNPGQGRLGDGTTAARSSPVQIGALTNWAQVSASNFNTHAVKTDGTLWAWGANRRGQLGQNNRIYRSSPVQIGALTNWAQVSGGNEFCSAVKTDGTLWAWGGNASGQLGNGYGNSYGYTAARSSPVQIGALTNWAQVSAANTCQAVKTDGTLWSWGSNGNGRLGDGTTIARSSPVQIGALTKWAQASAGTAHGFAILQE